MPTISHHITRDLAQRIGSSSSVPNLTLGALAEHYGVSFTPVRQAVRHLVATGLLLKEENGRIRVNPQWGGTTTALDASAPSAPPSRAAELEAALTEEIVGLGLRGESLYLREQATAERFGVGRTAIRQAFSRLAGRGLLVHDERRGWRVRAFDVAELDGYLQAREALELKALDLARPHLEESDLRAMLRGNASRSGQPRIDNNIHRYLIEKANNPYIRDFFERHGTYFTTLFDTAAPAARVVASMARQHRAILRALLDRDWPRARRELSRHVRSQRPIVLQWMKAVAKTETAQPAAESGDRR